MPRRLAEADAVVALLTPNSERSPSVWSEIGAARVLATGRKRTALLPVVHGLEVPPYWVHDMLVLRTAEGLTACVDEICRAIDAHVATLQSEAARAAFPKVFISHRHKDEAVARALVEALTMALPLESADIRCTSV